MTCPLVQCDIWTDYVQPVKSMRATLVVEPAVTASGWLFTSLEVVISDGMQSATPPLLDTAATVKSTSPATGGAMRYFWKEPTA